MCPGVIAGCDLRPLGILILGLGVRVVAIVTLGGAFSTNVATRAEEPAAKRTLQPHPSPFLSRSGTDSSAFALHARTWACFAVVLVPRTLAVLYRIHIEETALRLAFGAD
jgi:hypothetical protein